MLLRVLLFGLLSFASVARAEVDSLRSFLYGAEGFDLNWHHTFVKDSNSDDMIFVREEYNEEHGLVNHLMKITPEGDLVWDHPLHTGGSSFNIQSLIQTSTGQYAMLGGSPLQGVNCDLQLILMNEDSTISMVKSIANEPTDHGFAQTELPDGGMALAGYFGRGDGADLELDFWLIRLDSEGFEVFSETYGSQDCDETCHDIALTVDGGFLMAGIAGQNGYLVRTDRNADTLWTKIIDGYDNLYISSILATDDDCFVLAGNATNGNDIDGWIALIDRDGILISVRLIGGGAIDKFGDIIRTMDGKYALAGSNQSVDEEYGDFWLTKFETNLDLIWSESFGGDLGEEGKSLIQASDGSFAIIGSTTSFGAGNSDVWVVETTPDPDAYSSFTINIDRGWNFISSPLPVYSLTMPEVWEKVVYANHLMLVKDQIGNFYAPQFGFNAIPKWNFRQGYSVKLSSADSLVIASHEIPSNTPIPLREGWNIVSYLPKESLLVQDALQLLGDDLIMVKNDHGDFFDFRSGFSNMPLLTRGEGYSLRCARETDLVWSNNFIECLREPSKEQKITVHFPTTEPTGSDMSIIVDGNMYVNGELGAFTSDGIILGAVKLVNGERSGMAVRGDDVTTFEKDGALEGENITFRIWNGKAEFDISAKWSKGNGSYQKDDLALISLEEFSSTVESFCVDSFYPNPFNGTIKFSYSLPSEGLTTVQIVNAVGQLVATLKDTEQSEGEQMLIWSANALPSGSYFVRITHNGASVMSEVKLIR